MARWHHRPIRELSAGAEAIHRIALFDWMIDVANYQGISDAIAWTYLEKHGRVRWADIHAHFQRGPTCPKLTSFETFTGCNYRKAGQSCAHPEHFRSCSLPTHPLRKCGLNQTAYPRYLLLRDVCEGDVVAWINRQLEEADVPGAPNQVQRMRATLLGPLGSVHGPRSISVTEVEAGMGEVSRSTT